MSPHFKWFLLYKTEYRYILRTRDGRDVLQPNGQLRVFPSYMSAVRGRAMLDPRYLIIQQELVS